MTFVSRDEVIAQDQATQSETTQDSAIRADDLDLEIVNCLQVSPRASWALVGEALGVDPVTVARRWGRLHRTGTAWVTGRAAGHGGPDSCLAVIELACAASETLAIAHRIARLPHVLSVEHTSGPRSITMLVEVSDLAFLSRFLLESLDRIPGVVGTRSHAVTKVMTMGDGWRLKVLGRHQIAVMKRGATRRAGAPGSDGAAGIAGEQPVVVRPYDAIDRQVILLLGEDGRMPVPTMAARTGLSESTVRRRLADLVTHGRVVLRADMALPASGWPVITWIWAYVRPDDTDTLSSILGRSQNIRVCWRISGGQPNLLLALNTHSIHEVPAIEAQLAEVAPRLTIVDRSMVLRSIKRMGRELDAAGRSTAAVPMDVWSEPVDPSPPKA